MSPPIRHTTLFFAFVFNVSGCALFLKWILETDIMFGHYEGPALLLFAGTSLLVLGILASLSWFGSVLWAWFRGGPASGGKRWVGVVTGGALTVVLIPSGVFGFYGSLVVLGKFAESPAIKPMIEAFHRATAEPPSHFETAQTPQELTPYLDDEDFENRINAAGFLGKMGSRAQSAVPDLRARLDDPAPRVRVTVAEALWKITGEADESVHALIDVVESADPESLGYELAIFELAEIGPPAKDAIPVLEKTARSHKNPQMRQQAEYAIEYIQGADQAADS